MANKISINFDRLNNTIEAYQKAYDDLKQATEDVKVAMDRLKGTKWVSSASSAYFNQYSEEWKVSIDQHLTALLKLKQGLEKARDEYEDLYEIIGKLGDVITV